MSTKGLTGIGTANQSLHPPGRNVCRCPARSIVSESSAASMRNGTSSRRGTPRATSSFSTAPRRARRSSRSPRPATASSST